MRFLADAGISRKMVEFLRLRTGISTGASTDPASDREGNRVSSTRGETYGTVIAAASACRF